MNINDVSYSDSQTAVIDTFRELWMQYFIWMTNQLINIVCGFGNLSFIKERINEKLQNFVLEIEQYYGYQNAIYFELLLSKYLDIVTELLNAFKSGDLQAASAVRTESLRVADDIADFLSGINPYWDKAEWQYLIYKHLDLIEEQFIYRMNDVCVTEIKSDQNILNHILEISDYMSQGIIKQFNI
ncbi:MAG: hypothetical protein ACYCWE_20830 [Eubacteriales bacterium]